MLASTLACILIPRADASVLVVDPGGQGDSPTIQGAVALAAAGDTIRIRPGIYGESTQYPFPWATWETYVAIDKDNLTLIGDSRDSVIIGPPTANFNYTTMEPKGFVSSGLFRLAIRNVTVRNCYDGFNADGDITLDNIATVSCEIGAVIRGSTGLHVVDSSFSSGDTGVFVASGSVAPEIRNCAFLDCGVGVNVANSQQALVFGIVAERVSIGIEFEQLASGSIESCTISDATVANLSLQDAGSVSVSNCFFGPGANYSAFINGGAVDIIGSTIGLGNRNTIVLSSAAAATITTCDIAVADSQSINCVSGAYIGDPPALISMENNYWALPDSQSIADVVWDMNDDPTIKAIVDFVPYSLTSVPVQRSSMGSIKALFADPR